MTNTGSTSTRTLLALAALKGKLHDSSGPVRYWGLDYSTGQIKEYHGSKSAFIQVEEMPIWDRKRLVEDLNESFKKGVQSA